MLFRSTFNKLYNSFHLHTPKRESSKVKGIIQFIESQVVKEFNTLITFMSLFLAA